MKRFHVHLHVNDLAANIAFYSRLFGAAPTRVEADYAKWMLEDPRVNFAISTRGATPGVDHLGFQVDEASELGELKARAQHAKAAGAPLIVAVNKMDKPGATSQKVVNELLQYEVIAESLGGDTQIIEVSAKERMNLDGLLEAILVQAEVMDLRANADRSAEGVVIEAKLDKGRGPVATVLVKRGTLRRGDIVVAGGSWGKVRALLNERN